MAAPIEEQFSDRRRSKRGGSPGARRFAALMTVAASVVAVAMKAMSV